jgi:hypothetical protein
MAKTGQELIDLFNSLIDDSLDNDTALVLLNDAKTELEGERTWYCLKKKDSSLFSLTSDNYETQKALPADYSETLKIVLEGISGPLAGINFEEQEDFKNDFGYFFLDIAAGKLHLTGTPDQERKIYHFYKAFTPEIGLDTSWSVFPDRFHPILAYKMAAKFYNIDFSDISAQAGADKMWIRNAAILQQSLNNWDNNHKVAANGSRTGYRGYNDPSSI